ncbi:hypothetical protein QCM80_42030 [Bradyrhizobium sp. SSUT112]|uniref:hypothetical protein n=1 Tax=Bradyrhizobium sp. SSUT112 TaxID=3040604 RepID=UPI00244919D1|nr:hypothetical protein [Bradyrhizobium sp. SSUT112]MDH2357117.1 hypothetical protein [Bradyrhizobium sp. SSUT112]
MKFVLCVLLVSIVTHPALALDPAECRFIADPGARLACYDNIFAPGKRAAGVALDQVAHTNPDGSSSNDGKSTMDYSWAGVAGCRSISHAPAFKFSNLPANAQSVVLVLTQGEREFGGQEIALPRSGLIAEGQVTMRGPCVPGMYRWTATIKSETGVILSTVYADRRFPAD